VPNTTIKLLLFPFSLEGEARIWLDKEPPRSILTWKDLVSKFINQFFTPSKTTYLRNENTNFLQKSNETFNEAWERFKDLLRQCPHHGFSELHQLDTFYNALNPNDQDALDSAAGGNFLSMTPELHRQFENYSPYEKLQELKSMFEKQAEVESNKRAKHNLYSIYLWPCRLAHISKKRIEKLQQEGLLKSINDESFDQCVSCLSGKMTRKAFSHHTEGATDLLEIIHTDVCGPLRHVSRQGASYFITFTDDYSRYGYVYLLKHKHEVFETFKVFKNKVENQLGKTIKAFRSDRGGEYRSQEFKYYLKACGIVQHITPSYTLQHNGVSERRNHTLLDMV
nr:retrotransposon protein, putative, Ty1-copia subclass [Tanacetum cinerariifolium]